MRFGFYVIITIIIACDRYLTEREETIICSMDGNQKIFCLIFQFSFLLIIIKVQLGWWRQFARNLFHFHVQIDAAAFVVVVGVVVIDASMAFGQQEVLYETVMVCYLLDFVVVFQNLNLRKLIRDVHHSSHHSSLKSHLVIVSWYNLILTLCSVAARLSRCWPDPLTARPVLDNAGWKNGHLIALVNWIFRWFLNLCLFCAAIWLKICVWRGLC